MRLRLRGPRQRLRERRRDELRELRRDRFVRARLLLKRDRAQRQRPLRPAAALAVRPYVLRRRQMQLRLRSRRHRLRRQHHLVLRKLRRRQLLSLRMRSLPRRQLAVPQTAAALELFGAPLPRRGALRLRLRLRRPRLRNGERRVLR